MRTWAYAGQLGGALALLTVLIGTTPAASAGEAADVTLEQARAALRSLWASTQTKRLKFVHTDSHTPDDEARADRPTRREEEIIATADGRLLHHSQYFQNGKVWNEKRLGFDGTRCVQYEDRRDINDARAYLSREVPSDRRFLASVSQTFLHRFSYHKRFDEFIDAPDARLVGVVDVSGHECVRVQGVIPKGFHQFSDDVLIYLDLDPAKDFWPRRFSAVFSADRSNPAIISEALEFQKFDDIWIPTRIRNQKRTRVTYTFVQEAAFNRDFPDEMFRVDIPPGVRVSDGIKGGTYISGGAEGRRLAETRALERAARREGTAIATQVNGLPATWLLASAGVLLIVVALLVRIRAHKSIS